MEVLGNYAPATSFSGTARHEVIMLQNLSIMLLSSAPKITYYAFEKMPIIPKIMQPILANDVSL